MSIQVELSAALKTRALYRLRAVIPGPLPHRQLLISPEVRTFVLSGTQRAMQLRADLDLYSNCGNIMACMRPFEARYALFGLLDPTSDGVWDIRSRAAPALRIIGGFIERDCFIGLTLHQRTLLGGRQSTQWARAIERCRMEWQTLFSHPRITGGNIHDYISRNVSLE